MRPIKPHSGFTRFAKWTARMSGRPGTFVLAVAVILGWAALGPLFGYSDSWQLVINTSTTIVTFLMVFLIQNTQYRDSEAVQIKLDELIRAVKGAHNIMVDLEDATDGDLERIRANYQDLARKAKEDVERGKQDTGSPNVIITPNNSDAEPQEGDNRHLTDKR
jgi:low affinity Fe/Cu permease